ncbi:4-coumarate--CoA ligase 5-like [Haliotis rubra]|uniref:4-coumarate--CoA ligase 5-like n=1 Tax=Haliotis rubra TaxID=36100 RepID=UPI001EE5A505|nr:4-coumarate--CoA ligase 5-like [Haliotis rubra]
MRVVLARIFSRLYHGQPVTFNTPVRCGVPRGLVLQNSAKVSHHAGECSFSSSSSGILRSPFPDEDIATDPLAEHLLHRFYSLGDLDALVDYDTKEAFTFSELSDAVVAVASSLTKRGYVKGDVIAVVTPNNVHITSLVLGVSAIGATVAMIDPTSTPEEISRQLHDCGAKCVVCSQPLVTLVKNISQTHGIKDLFVLGDAEGVTSFSTLLEDDGRMFRDDIVINPDNDVMGLFYTGGTTGPPKSVMLTHSNIVSALHQIRVPVHVRTGLEKVLSVTPSHHIYSLVMAHLGVLQDGGMIVSLQHPNPHHCLQAVDTYGITRLYTVPSTLKQLTTADPGYDLSSLESVYCGAAPSRGR